MPDPTPLTEASQAKVEELQALARHAVKKQEGTDLLVTTASEWRRKKSEGFVVALPSGNVVRVVRSLDMTDMLSSGKLPNPLSRFISKMMSGESMEDASSEMTEEDLLAILTWIDDQVIASMKEPRVVRRPTDAPEDWEPPEGAIELSDIEQVDRMFLSGIAQGGPTDFNRFREGAVTAMEGLLDR